MGKKTNENNDEKLIDMFGEAIDKILEANEVKLLMTLPKGSMDAEIQSNLTDPTLEFYIMLHGLAAGIININKVAPVDPDKKEEMIDGILEMVKKALMEAKL